MQAATLRQVTALDVGGSSVKSALVAPQGQVLGQLVDTPIDSSAPAAQVLSVLSAVIARHLEQAQPAQLLGVVLGFPGPFDYEHGISLVRGVAKYAALYGLNLRSSLEARLPLAGLPVLFRNDAEAAIVGEACYGAGKTYDRLVGVTLGTGFGSAFIANGLPVKSGPGVPPNGWLYPLRFRGERADDLFSRRGLEARLKAAGCAEREVKSAAQAAREGDKRARSVFASFGADLGDFLVPVVAGFQAEVVLVLGKIAGALDLFGASLRSTLPVPALPGERGPEAALLGAADLFFKQCQETP